MKNFNSFLRNVLPSRYDMCVCVCVCVCHQFNVRYLVEKKYENEKREEKRKLKIEKCYFVILAFFDEKIKRVSLEGFVCASAGLGMNGSTLVRIPAFASFKTRFLDGTLRSCVDPKIPCSFGALWGDIALSAGAIEKEAPPFPTDLQSSSHVS